MKRDNDDSTVVIVLRAKCNVMKTDVDCAHDWYKCNAQQPVNMASGREKASSSQHRERNLTRIANGRNCYVMVPLESTVQKIIVISRRSVSTTVTSQSRVPKTVSTK